MALPSVPVLPGGARRPRLWGLQSVTEGLAAEPQAEPRSGLSGAFSPSHVAAGSPVSGGAEGRRAGGQPGGALPGGAL